MLVDKTDIEVQGIIPGEKVAMGIHAPAMAYVMKALTDLYSDEEKAVIREIATNAFDAHVEAGQTRPIEVTLPGPLSPYFKVRDYGNGMSVDTIHNVYSQYGASTKRDTNDQVGQLGFGCKAPLTYTNQFRLVSINEGIRIEVLISRTPEGGGEMVIVVPATATDEPSGVEVIVPVNADNAFQRKAEQFFSFWDAGTVLVDGIAPEPIEGLEITDTIMVTKEAKSYVVMGNVPYPAEIEHGMPYGNGLVVRVPIGAVNFTPPREALHYTDKTKAVIAEIEQEFQTHAPDAIQREMDKAESACEAIQILIDHQQVLPTGNNAFTYKGKNVPRLFTPGPDFLVTERWSDKLSRKSKQRSMSVESFPKTVWVTGYDRPSFSAAQKKKLNKWADDNGINACERYALLEDGTKPPTEWIDPSMVIDWATIHEIKLPRTYSGGSTASGRLPGSYDIWENGELCTETPADDIDASNGSLFYYVSSDAWDINSYVKAMQKHYGDHTVVVITPNRVNKLIRTFPGITPFMDTYRELGKIWLSTLTAEQRLACEIQGRYSDFKVLDSRKVHDPRIKRAIKAYKMDVKEIRQIANELGIRVTSKRWTNPLADYPLFDQYDFNRHKDHMYIYLNAAYAASKESK